jgi:hypothetical protein
MALTLEDLKKRMARALNEVEVLEVLEINTEQLVERFEDLILEKYNYLIEELELEGEEDDKIQQSDD